MNPRPGSFSRRAHSPWRRLALALGVAGLAGAGGFAAPTSPATPTADQGEPAPDGGQVIRFTLDNGLTVLVLPDPRVPLVNVTMAYGVGGAHEEAGITGLAHYVEHMAFRSTENLSNVDLTGIIERIGGRWNGYTSLDRTLYGATVPSWALESVLHIEAERMVGVRFDEDEFERERTSVIAELQGGEDAVAVLRETVTAHSFEHHPYRTGVIGRITDLLTVTVEQGERFYRSYYGPNNAVLVVVGDVDPSQARRLVTEHFEAIEPAPRPIGIPAVEPAQLGEKRLEVTHPAATAHLRIAFRAPGASHPDYPSLMVLDAMLTGRGGVLQAGGSALPGSRLHRAVSQAGGWGASTNFSPTRYPGLYVISAEAPGGDELEEVERAVYAELDRVTGGDVSPGEVGVAWSRIRTGAVFEATDLRETAHRLVVFELLGDWRMADGLLEQASTKSPRDLRDYARAWLQPHQRTVGLHRPGPRRRTRVHVPAPPVEPLALPRPLAVPEPALRPLPHPPVEVGTRELANGVRLLAAGHGGPIGALHLRVGFGSADDPSGKEGLALLAGRWIAEHPALNELQGELGARVRSSATDFYSLENRGHIDLTIRFLPEHLPHVVRAVATALDDLPADEARLRSLQASQVARLASHDTRGRWQAQEAVLRRLGGGWRPPAGSASSVEAITPGDLDRFLARHLGTGRVVVGLATPEPPGGVLETVAAQLGVVALPGARSPRDAAGEGTRDAATGAGQVSDPGRPDPVLIPLPGESQATIVAAVPGVDRSHPDHLPLRLVSYILGETGYAGRLGSALVRNGLAYAVYATPEFHREPGPLLIRTSTATATVQAVLEAIRGVIREIEEDGIEPWEFREAQAFRIGRMAAELEPAPSLARLLVEDAYFGRPPLDLPARSREVLDLTPARLEEVAREYLRADRLVLAAAGALEVGAGEGQPERP